ncbi:DUF604 domain-containing protein [Cephalotus follicularis]|uniref:DUF604 domain-containing protein n=1 Tax=Cephalotus follicularis TaxID=3775 RepID=A0A1Q3C5X0_CEPFO|nr:DUF604 domain-containing protein [Cephalotus follicularis]
MLCSSFLYDPNSPKFNTNQLPHATVKSHSSLTILQNNTIQNYTSIQNHTIPQSDLSLTIIQNNTIQISTSIQNNAIPEKTNLSHIVFGIAGSANLWNNRKNYVKLWWRQDNMRGFVWLDKPVNYNNNTRDDKLLPPMKISSDTSRFKYEHDKGDRSAIRISRIVSETLRLGIDNVRWFVMGDDDTVFVIDNLVRVLSKYDHNQFYYIGTTSETHLQNIRFSYGMAYGGGGFAISYPLAKALARMQDECIQRYPTLYGSDDRIQACMAELGVPLTREPGFHQFDVYGSVFGLLAAHPIAPLVSLHHLDVIEPIFPYTNRVRALQRLLVPMKLDSAGLMQQSICYDRINSWTVSVSWGYATQIIRGKISAREMDRPLTTFLSWYRKSDYDQFSFNTRPLSKNSCKKPFVYYLSNAIYNPHTNQTASEYIRYRDRKNSNCKWKRKDPSTIERVEVYKTRDPHLWDKVMYFSNYMLYIAYIN